MKVKFWGVRGSAAVPDADKLRYGGNTSSIVVNSPRRPHSYFMLDAGTGLARFGNTMGLSEAYTATVLLCHLHLYHIIGFQFTPLAYSEQCQTLVIGPNTRNFALESVFDHIMTSSYSPVYGIENLMAQVKFREVSQTTYHLEGMVITAMPLPHSTETYSWAYRIENEQRSLVYMTDAFLTIPNTGLDPQVIKLAQGADVLIGGTYDPHHHANDRSTYQDYIDLMHQAQVGSLYFVHHHPAASDDHLDGVQALLKQEYPNKQIIIASEGLEIDLSE